RSFSEKVSYSVTVKKRDVKTFLFGWACSTINDDAPLFTETSARAACARRPRGFRETARRRKPLLLLHRGEESRD
ncbi:MAG: hypothetical protein ACXV5E_08355, partial [Halobacteriota archaeon]